MTYCLKTVENMRKLSFLLIFLSLNLLVEAQNTLTPERILGKTVALISNTQGVEANFKVYNSGYSGSGSVKTRGEKFRVTLPDAQVWYNGKDLYTYNGNSKETTVIVPTPEELSQTNPLAYVSNAPKSYNVAFSTVNKSGCYVLELTPKTKGNEVKRITLTVGKNDFYPQKIVVEPTTGAPISADITSFKTGVGATQSEFEYPKSKFPGVELIDLR